MALYPSAPPISSARVAPLAATMRRRKRPSSSDTASWSESAALMAWSSLTTSGGRADDCAWGDDDCAWGDDDCAWGDDDCAWGDDDCAWGAACEDLSPRARATISAATRSLMGAPLRGPSPAT